MENCTLIKPPSGLARRNAGCTLVRGCSSCTDLIWNFGTGPRPGTCDCNEPERGDRDPGPNALLGWELADKG